MVPQGHTAISFILSILLRLLVRLGEVSASALGLAELSALFVWCVVGRGSGVSFCTGKLDFSGGLCDLVACGVITVSWGEWPVRLGEGIGLGTFFFADERGFIGGLGDFCTSGLDVTSLSFGGWSSTGTEDTWSLPFWATKGKHPSLKFLLCWNLLLRTSRRKSSLPRRALSLEFCAVGIFRAADGSKLPRLFPWGMLMKKSVLGRLPWDKLGAEDAFDSWLDRRLVPSGPSLLPLMSSLSMGNSSPPTLVYPRSSLGSLYFLQQQNTKSPTMMARIIPQAMAATEEMVMMSLRSLGSSSSMNPPDCHSTPTLLLLVKMKGWPWKVENVEAILWLCTTLQWRRNGHDCVSNHQPHDCLLNRLFGRISKKTPKLRITGLCEGNSPVTGEFPSQRASYAKSVSIWWRHHDKGYFVT